MVLPLHLTGNGTGTGDVLVRFGNINREMNGLKSIVNSSGVLYNIDPSVEP
jgi:hypothetical protein